MPDETGPGNAPTPIPTDWKALLVKDFASGMKQILKAALGMTPEEFQAEFPNLSALVMSSGAFSEMGVDPQDEALRQFLVTLKGVQERMSTINVGTKEVSLEEMGSEGVKPLRDIDQGLGELLPERTQSLMQKFLTQSDEAQEMRLKGDWGDAASQTLVQNRYAYKVAQFAGKLGVSASAALANQNLPLPVQQNAHKAFGVWAAGLPKEMAQKKLDAGIAVQLGTNPQTSSGFREALISRLAQPRAPAVHHNYGGKGGSGGRATNENENTNAGGGKGFIERVADQVRSKGQTVVDKVTGKTPEETEEEAEPKGKTPEELAEGREAPAAEPETEAPKPKPEGTAETPQEGPGEGKTTPQAEPPTGEASPAEATEAASEANGEVKGGSNEGETVQEDEGTPKEDTGGPTEDTTWSRTSYPKKGTLALQLLYNNNGRMDTQKLVDAVRDQVFDGDVDAAKGLLMTLEVDGLLKENNDGKIVLLDDGKKRVEAENAGAEEAGPNPASSEDEGEGAGEDADEAAESKGTAPVNDEDVGTTGRGKEEVEGTTETTPPSPKILALQILAENGGHMQGEKFVPVLAAKVFDGDEEAAEGLLSALASEGLVEDNLGGMTNLLNKGRDLLTQPNPAPKGTEETEGTSGGAKEPTEDEGNGKTSETGNGEGETGGGTEGETPKETGGSGTGKGTPVRVRYPDNGEDPDSTQARYERAREDLDRARGLMEDKMGFVEYKKKKDDPNVLGKYLEYALMERALAAREGFGIMPKDSHQYLQEMESLAGLSQTVVRHAMRRAASKTEEQLGEELRAAGVKTAPHGRVPLGSTFLHEAKRFLDSLENYNEEDLGRNKADREKTQDTISTLRDLFNQANYYRENPEGLQGVLESAEYDGKTGIDALNALRREMKRVDRDNYVPPRGQGVDEVNAPKGGHGRSDYRIFQSFTKEVYDNVRDNMATSGKDVLPVLPSLEEFRDKLLARSPASFAQLFRNSVKPFWADLGLTEKEGASYLPNHDLENIRAHGKWHEVNTGMPKLSNVQFGAIVDMLPDKLEEITPELINAIKNRFGEAATPEIIEEAKQVKADRKRRGQGVQVDETEEGEPLFQGYGPRAAGNEAPTPKVDTGTVNPEDRISGKDIRGPGYDVEGIEVTPKTQTHGASIRNLPPPRTPKDNEGNNVKTGNKTHQTENTSTESNATRFGRNLRALSGRRSDPLHPEDEEASKMMNQVLKMMAQHVDKFERKQSTEAKYRARLSKILQKRAESFDLNDPTETNRP